MPTSLNPYFRIVNYNFQEKPSRQQKIRQRTSRFDESIALREERERGIVTHISQGPIENLR